MNLIFGYPSTYSSRSHLPCVSIAFFSFIPNDVAVSVCSLLEYWVVSQEGTLYDNRRIVKDIGIFCEGVYVRIAHVNEKWVIIYFVEVDAFFAEPS